MTGITRSFWQKYAYCTEYAWKQGCEQYRIAKHGATHYMKTYMADMSKNITNLDQEENPLKCHWSKLWTNKTNQMAIYAAHWRSWQNLDVVTLKVNNVYKTIAIDMPTIQEDPEGEGSTFTCRIAMNDFC